MYNFKSTLELLTHTGKPPFQMLFPFIWKKNNNVLWITVYLHSEQNRDSV